MLTSSGRVVFVQKPLDMKRAHLKFFFAYK